MPEDLLECNDGEMLNRWLSLLVKETRRVGGKDVDQRCHGVEGQSLQLCCLRVSIFYHLCEILLYHWISNHSLRVTGATCMWEANVPEKLTEEKTGHRSLEALRSYERTSITQQKAISGVLASSEDTDYQSEVSNKGQILPVSRPSSLIHQPISDTSAATRGELFGKAFQSHHNKCQCELQQVSKLYL